MKKSMAFLFAAFLACGPLSQSVSAAATRVGAEVGTRVLPRTMIPASSASIPGQAGASINGGTRLGAGFQQTQESLVPAFKKIDDAKKVADLAGGSAAASQMAATISGEKLISVEGDAGAIAAQSVPVPSSLSVGVKVETAPKSSGLLRASRRAAVIAASVPGVLLLGAKAVHANAMAGDIWVGFWSNAFLSLITYGVSAFIGLVVGAALNVLSLLVGNPGEQGAKALMVSGAVATVLLDMFGIGPMSLFMAYLP